MRDLDEVAYTKAVENSWASFLGSRFDNALSGYDGPSQRAARTRIADIELATIHKTLALANQRRNATTAAAGLPAELLAMIFSAAAQGWTPLRTPEDDDEEEGGGGPLFYDLGWLLVTHVCRSWRKAAISSSNLWNRLECLEIPPQLTTDVLLRSKRLPLELVIRDNLSQSPEDYRNSVSVISGWLCGPSLLRTRKLILDILTPVLVGSVYFLRAAAPILEELVIILDRETRLPDHILSLHECSTLKRLELTNCLPRWNNPSIPPALTHLRLGGQGWRDVVDRTYYPHIAQFQAFLTSLPLLEHLSLDDFFPVRNDGPGEPEVIHLSPSLKRFHLTCSWARLLCEFQDDLWRYFKFAPTTILVSRITAIDLPIYLEEDDRGIFQPIFELKDETLPAAELYVSSSDISIRRSFVTDRQHWTWRWQNERDDRSPIGDDPDFLFDTAAGSRHVFTSAIHPYFYLDDRFLLGTIRSMHFSEDAQGHFEDSTSWLDTFSAQCFKVERLSFAFVDSYTLLSALSLPDAGRTHSDGMFQLFPHLKILVIHGGSVCWPTKEDTAAVDEHRVARDVSMLYLLEARREAGWPIEELLVDRALEGWSVWGKLGEEVTLSYFD